VVEYYNAISNISGLIKILGWTIHLSTLAIYSLYWRIRIFNTTSYYATVFSLG